MLNMKSMDTICMSCFTQHEAPASTCPVCGYNEAAQEVLPHQLRPRSILNGKYLLGRVLGEGGFGITYIGWDLNLDVKVAIKEYYPAGYVTRETTAASTGGTVQPFTGAQGDFFIHGREKFINEAKALAKFFSLPGIVSIRDYFQENGTAYISMEYIEGQTLKSYLAQKGGRLPAAQVFDMMRPVMASLAQVHTTGLIHRDISPDNIMLSKEGHMKLLDFGAARDYTESGSKSLSIMLKPGFAPEEQYRSKGVQGPWTDIYALCATMYRCITGVTPDESVERARRDEVRPPSALGIDIGWVQESALMKGMAVFQEGRFHDIMELYAALYEAQGAPPQGTVGNMAAPAYVTAPGNVATPVDSVPPLASAVPYGVFTPVAEAQADGQNRSPFNKTEKANNSTFTGWARQHKAFTGICIGALAVLIVSGIVIGSLNGGETDVPVGIVADIDVTPPSASTDATSQPADATSQPADTTSQPADTTSQPADATPQPEAINESSNSYERGILTENSFESKYLDIRFTLPPGFSMATEDDILDMMNMSAEIMGADQRTIDYALLTTVYEMMASASISGTPNVLVMAEKLPFGNMTIEQYLDILIPQLEDMDYKYSNDKTSITIAGQSYQQVDFSVEIYNTSIKQSYMLRKIDDRMVAIIGTYTDDTEADYYTLLKGFTKY